MENNFSLLVKFIFYECDILRFDIFYSSDGNTIFLCVHRHGCIGKTNPIPPVFVIEFKFIFSFDKLLSIINCINWK